MFHHHYFRQINRTSRLMSAKIWAHSTSAKRPSSASTNSSRTLGLTPGSCPLDAHRRVAGRDFRRRGICKFIWITYTLIIIEIQKSETKRHLEIIQELKMFKKGYKFYDFYKQKLQFLLRYRQTLFFP